MKTILIIAIYLLGFVAFNEALQCYEHSLCLNNCPQLQSTIKTCAAEDTKCYKAAFPGGVTRGCGKERCSVTVDASSIFANVCCEKDLCNSSNTLTSTVFGVFTAIMVLFFARMM